MKYRKKPVVVEAMQFTDDTAQRVMEWMGSGYTAFPAGFTWDGGEPEPGYLLVHTLEGSMRANVGDWIVKGVQGEFYPCKPDIFAATYELVVPE